LRNQLIRSNEPAERWIPLFFKLFVYLWLSYFFFQAATAFIEYIPGKPWPFMLIIFRTFTFLPIHEAGHFLFMFFGRTLYILGGSFWQIMFMVLWFIIALRQKSQVAPFPLFWVGENMMDVSLYMRDAPLRQMPLLGGHKSGHDWHNLFTEWNMMDSAETFADIMYYLGCIICLAAIIAGVTLAVRSFLNPSMPVFANAGTSIEPSVLTLEDSLDEMLEKKNRKPPAN
jgi:hypothetical protein